MTVPGPRRVAIKVDVDTYRGAREGLPAVLADLSAAGVRATFFLTFGPDNSGKAILRAFTKPGFVAKMLRTNALRMYGGKTVFYGTLLPAPRIGRLCADIFRRCVAEQHEVGLHAWDHVLWQDHLPTLDGGMIDAALDRGVNAFVETFGAEPHAFAAPAWLCTDDAFEAIERRHFDYISVTRGAVAPFHPRIRQRDLTTLEIPTTLPTLDEELGRSGVTTRNYVDRLVARYRHGVTEVLTVHAETEGLAYRRLFQELLDRHRQLGVQTVTLRELARESRAAAVSCDVRLGGIPGRAGAVTMPAGC